MIASDKASLEAAANETLAEARANPCQETRQAAANASRALSQWIVANEAPKRGPFSDRSNQAGKRQYREHLARHGLTKYLNK